jgi:hypothetical protein
MARGPKKSSKSLMLVAELNKFMPIMNLENVILNNAFSLTRHTLKKLIIIG